MFCVTAMQSGRLTDEPGAVLSPTQEFDQKVRPELMLGPDEPPSGV